MGPGLLVREHCEGELAALMHLLIDGEDARHSRLADKSRVRMLLRRLPRQMDMRIIKGPEVFSVEDADHPMDRGVTGFVVIAESHISIHTFPERGLLWADVFSCKDFDAEAVAIEICKAFVVNGQVTQMVLPRGLAEGS